MSSRDTATTNPTSAAGSAGAIRLPPLWVRAIWKSHRFLYQLTGGNFGLRTPTDRRWGMLRVTTIGRRSGQERAVILGYIEDGRDLVTPAMNGWADPEPAWWLNLQAHPDAVVNLPGGISRTVRARVANADERVRLWKRLVDLGTAAYTDEMAARRAREAAIVILEPRTEVG